MIQGTRPCHCLCTTGPLLLSAAAVLLGTLAVASPAAASSVTFTQPGPITVETDGTISMGAEGAGAMIPDASSEKSGHVRGRLRSSSRMRSGAPTETWVEVEVTVSHTHLDDLDLVLEAPDGRAVTLASDIGGSSDG